MTIQLSQNLEAAIRTLVQYGRFASLDEAMDAAARMLLREMGNLPQAASAANDSGIGSIGAMRDAADELDEAVEYAMKLRQQPWRVVAGE